jgi:hypothetical protein
MDPRTSPYAPGAGTTPILLAGREGELERFSILIDRLQGQRSTEAVLFAGARAMGKTVLLRECQRRARSADWFTTFEEVDPNDPAGVSSYAGRLYRILRLGPLDDDNARSALVEPAEASGVTYESEALEAAVDFAHGSPYFLQLVGEQAWEEARATAPPQIKADDVRHAIAQLQARLDAEFYPAMLGRLYGLPLDCLSWFAALGGANVTREEFLRASGLPWNLDTKLALDWLADRGILDVGGSRVYSISAPGMVEYLRRAGVAAHVDDGGGETALSGQ